MKATALIAAAALVCGTAAFAQQSYDRDARHDDTARAGQKDPSGNSLGNDMHRLGNKLRNGMHRLGNKLHAHGDRHGDTLHARNDRHDDTRAMGAAGDDHGRQSRMDDAYSNWRSQHGSDQRR